MPNPSRFNALRIHNDDASYRSGIESIGIDDLNPGEVLIKTAYSSVNYKDALAGTGKGRILRRFPLVGGIDVAGHVLQSRDPAFKEGDAVLATGCGLSETRDGGYAEYARLESRAVIALPAGLSLREAMILGTAGFTAALALLRMQANWQRPDLGPIAVTGASGGVGSLAIAIFKRAGYRVHAISGKADQADWLCSLGADEVLRRDVLADTQPLQSVRFGGGLDTAGGPMLASLLAQTASYGNVVSAGLAASADLPASVMPFILRGVSLVGVSSSNATREMREQVWARLAGEWKPATLEHICQGEIGLDGLTAAFERMLSGQSLGRVLVRMGHSSGHG
ncbi:MAG: YhdH/YhfP family quinone oxidoreductase [Pseudomonadota bacterium]|nr:YhdH/YhfP family quinone oxidoreductase [Pseudomonadota bacterium]